MRGRRDPGRLAEMMENGASLRGLGGEGHMDLKNGPADRRAGFSDRGERGIDMLWPGKNWQGPGFRHMQRRLQDTVLPFGRRSGIFRAFSGAARDLLAPGREAGTDLVWDRLFGAPFTSGPMPGAAAGQMAGVVQAAAGGISRLGVSALRSRYGPAVRGTGFPGSRPGQVQAGAASLQGGASAFQIDMARTAAGSMDNRRTQASGRGLWLQPEQMGQGVRAARRSPGEAVSGRDGRAGNSGVASVWQTSPRRLGADGMRVPAAGTLGGLRTAAAGGRIPPASFTKQARLETGMRLSPAGWMARGPQTDPQEDYRMAQETIRYIWEREGRPEAAVPFAGEPLTAGRVNAVQRDPDWKQMMEIWTDDFARRLDAAAEGVHR